MDLAADPEDDSEGDSDTSSSSDDEDGSDYDAGTTRQASKLSASFLFSSARNIVPPPLRAPTFENMCGSSFVHGFSVKESDVPAACLPPAVLRCHANNSMRHYWKTGIKRQQQQMMTNRVMDDARSSNIAGINSRGSSSSRCFDVFSIYGNLRLRRDMSGTHVTFKVKRPMLYVRACVCVCVCVHVCVCACMCVCECIGQVLNEY